MMPREVKSIKVKDFERMSIGREIERSERWSYVRAIETAVCNFGGMGATKYITEKEIRSIPYIDNSGMIFIEKIKTIQEAYEMIDKWLD